MAFLRKLLRTSRLGLPAHFDGLDAAPLQPATQRATYGTDSDISRNSMSRDGCIQRPETKASGIIPRARPCAACGTVAMLALGAGGAAGFQAIPPTPWTGHSGHAVSRAAVAHRSLGAPRAPSARYRWVLKSSETENRGAGEGGAGNVGSDEDNNWGMDDNIDVNAIRMKMMEKAGYAKRGESDAGEEWITVDEDGSDLTKDKMKDALAGELVGNEALQGADVSKLVEDLLEDTDMAKFFDEEFEKGTSALRALADELKTEQGTASYADTMAQELAELFQAEEEKAAKEIEERQGPVKAKLDKATAELEEAMADAQEARRAFEGDALLQLLSFRKKGVLRQAAFVGAILIANQAVYQAILVADDRGGSPVFALGGLVVSAGLVWAYGYRPFSL